MDAQTCDVLIVGAGPAGLATALYLLRARPDLAGRVIAIEKAVHPRFKTCAGGLIPKTILALGELGITLDVPAVEVVRGSARTPLGDVDLDRGGATLCTIVRRDEFDARLARAASDAGLRIVERCRALEIAQDEAGVRVVADRGAFAGKLLVGADGSGSRVRRSVFGPGKETIGRGLMADIAADSSRAIEFAERRYRFDFRCVSGGVRGYAWSFPCLIGGRPHLNVGIYDQLPRAGGAPGSEQARMLRELRRAFDDLELDGVGRGATSFHAYPIRWFDGRDRYVRGRVILAGDAAGADPLMGEGISCAFEHGKLAAGALAAFLDGDNSALETYDRALHQGAIGRKLSKLAFAARRFYGPRHRIFFRLAHLSRRAQEIGLDWYNGARHLDEVPTAALLSNWASAVLFGAPVR